MKIHLLTLASILISLLLLGCSKPEREPEAVPKNQVTVEKPAGLPAEIVEGGEKVKEATIEIADQMTTDAVEPVETEETANQVTEEVGEKTAAAKESAGQALTARNQTEILVEKNAQSVKEVTGDLDTSAPPNVPEIVVLENKKGKITLPHQMHSATIACRQCHGAAAPRPMKLGQEQGHALCRGCHKEQGVGPTTCNGCHEKKAIKAVEGC